MEICGRRPCRILESNGEDRSAFEDYDLLSSASPGAESERINHSLGSGQVQTPPIQDTGDQKSSDVNGLAYIGVGLLQFPP
jgi:hypothetical protein